MPKDNRVFVLKTEVTALGNRRGEVMVYSAISSYKWDGEDVTAFDFDKKLKALGDVDEISVRINSPGGVISEAIAIRTALMKHPAIKTIDIEGKCDSAATLIACLPGAHVRMAKGGEYMIHCCSGGAWGQAEKLLSTYNSMVKTNNEMADIYAERCGKSAEECMELMKAETWYTAEEAREAGFVDEIIAGTDNDLPMVACAVDAETMALMRECYAHVPDRNIIARASTTGEAPDSNVSNETSVVAADNAANGAAAPTAAPVSSENNNEGVNNMDELRNATAERKATSPGAKSFPAMAGNGAGQIKDLDFATLQSENPALAHTIAEDAVTAERKRVADINKLTRKGAKWQAMAQKAIAEGTSAADFLAAVIEEESKEGANFLDQREQETTAANGVGAGDAGDHDTSLEAKQNALAKELADMADAAQVNTADMFC